MIVWLFSSFSDLIDCLKASEQDIQKECEDLSPSIDRKPPGKPMNTFVGLMNSGVAVSTAARAVGVDPATGMAWAARNGIAIKKRPSKITRPVKNAMVRALRAGAAKDAVARLGNVSVNSVTRLLRTEVGLQAAWHDAQFVRRKRAARDAWSRVTGRNPLAGAKAMRMLEPATYAWLYRNDPDWLKDQIGRLERAERTVGTRVNWDERDRELAAEIAAVSLQISNRSPGKRVKLWQIYQLVPELRAKLSKLDRLPLTEIALAELIGGRRARLVTWDGER